MSDYNQDSTSIPAGSINLPPPPLGRPQTGLIGTSDFNSDLFVTSETSLDFYVILGTLSFSARILRDTLTQLDYSSSHEKIGDSYSRSGDYGIEPDAKSLTFYVKTTKPLDLLNRLVQQFASQDNFNITLGNGEYSFSNIVAGVKKITIKKFDSNFLIVQIDMFLVNQNWSGGIGSVVF